MKINPKTNLERIQFLTKEQVNLSAEKLEQKDSNLTNEKIGNLIIILFWSLVVLVMLYGLGGMSLVLNGIGFIIGVPILVLFFGIIYKTGNRFHWWFDA